MHLIWKWIFHQQGADAFYAEVGRWKLEVILTNNYISTRGHIGHMLKLEVGSYIFFVRVTIEHVDMEVGSWICQCHHCNLEVGSWIFFSVTIEHV